MSWRIVVITKRAKLDLKLNYLVIRSDETTKIFLGEISTLIIESTAVSLTAALLSELISRKIKVIFCDFARNPQAEMIPYYGSHDTSNKVRKQLNWKAVTKELTWTEIVTEKIRKQKELLQLYDHPESKLLDDYLLQLEPRDLSNREGHAAKVYFNALFGSGFTRTSDTPTNAALNYGYTIMLSAFSREIVASGYITQIGLFHDNMFNQFNYASDLMEPFRPLVDKKVLLINPEKFERDEKLQLIDLLNEEVIIEDKHQYINNAIKLYCKSVFEALNEDDISRIRFYRNEL